MSTQQHQQQQQQQPSLTVKSAVSVNHIRLESAHTDDTKRSNDQDYYSIPQPRFNNLFQNHFSAKSRKPSSPISTDSSSTNEPPISPLSFSSSSSSSNGPKTKIRQEKAASSLALNEMMKSNRHFASVIQCENSNKKPIVLDSGEEEMKINRKRFRSKKQAYERQHYRYGIAHNQPAESLKRLDKSTDQEDLLNNLLRTHRLAPRASESRQENPSPQTKSAQQPQQQQQQQQHQKVHRQYSQTSTPASTSVVKETWKSDLLKRYSRKYERPKYFVEVSEESLKTDPGAPELHFIASDTYFLNTMPTKRSTFTIHPEFISESLDVRKVLLSKKMAAEGKAALSSTEKEEALRNLRFRRDYAFVY